LLNRGEGKGILLPDEKNEMPDLNKFTEREKKHEGGKGGEDISHGTLFRGKSVTSAEGGKESLSCHIYLREKKKNDFTARIDKEGGGGEMTPLVSLGTS